MKKITGTALAAHLSCTRETIGDYVANKIITKLADGKFDQDACRSRVLKHLRAKAAGRSGTVGAGGIDLATERAGLARANRLRAERENAEAAGKLVEVEAVGRFVESEYSNVKENFLAAPGVHANAIADAARGAPNLQAATILVEAKLREIIYEILELLSDPEQVVERASARDKKAAGQPARPSTDEAAEQQPDGGDNG